MKRRRRRGRIVAMALGVSVGVPLPAWAALAHLTGRPGLVSALVLLLTVPFVVSIRSLWEHRPDARLRLYLVLWPFFLWWSFGLCFVGLGPLALLAAALTPVSLDQALAVAVAGSAIGALRSFSQRARVREHTVAVAGLPAAFDGYRVAQISDLHCGPFVPPARIRQWVQQVNDLGADLVAVTGDLITSGEAYVPAVSACLGALRARDGAYGCMGNHDYFTDGEAFAHELERRGLPLLRNRGVVLEREGTHLYLCGVDDTWTGRHDLARALRGRPAGAPVLLLAHDPALFPAAAERGVALTLAGHTHGGQIAFPLAPRRWNLARLMSRFTTGLYQRGDSSLYVNRGLGTTGPPVRIGARPEIALLTLVSAGDAADEPAPQDVAAQ